MLQGIYLLVSFMARYNLSCPCKLQKFWMKWAPNIIQGSARRSIAFATVGAAPLV